MNTHDFYNLLEKRTIRARLRDGIYVFPADFIACYNAKIEEIEAAVKLANKLIEQMALLEKQHFEIVNGQRGK